MTPVIRTERLLLEPYVPDDEDDFVHLFGDEEVARWMGDGPQSEEENRALFGRVFTHVYPTGRFDVWGVREDGRLVGHAEITDTTDVDGHEIIHALAPAVWGRGLGTGLAGALVTYGFEELGLAEVHATVARESSEVDPTALDSADTTPVRECIVMPSGCDEQRASLRKAPRMPRRKDRSSQGMNHG